MPSAEDAMTSMASASMGSAEDVDWPLVSVVLPTRGRPELVRESIIAVIEQTYPGPVECIVVHDQEPIRVELESLGTTEHRVKVVTNTNSPGLAGARNTGLDISKGAFVASCDDDDVWHPTKLQRQVRRLLDLPELLAVGCGLRLRLPGGKAADWPARAERLERSLILRNRVKELHSSTLVMRRDAFAKAGRYDEEIPHGYAEDYDLVLRLSRVGLIGAVTEPLADIRKDVQSWYQGRSQNTVDGLEYLLRKHPDLKTTARGHARILGQIAFARSCMGQRGAAARLALRALTRWPLSPHGYLALGHAATGVAPERVLKGARYFGRGIV
jgi:glycosyltransferase involved in cell wall biosynthesis